MAYLGFTIRDSEAIQAAMYLLLATADAFDAAGCGYQSARTMVLAAGDRAAL